MKLLVLIIFSVLIALAGAYPHFGVVEKRENHKNNSSSSSSSSESGESDGQTTAESIIRVLPEGSTVEAVVIEVETSTVAPEEGSGEEEELLFPNLPFILP